MHRSLGTILPALLDLWFWEPPGWTSVVADDMFVVYDGDNNVAACAPLANAHAVRRLKSLMDTVNLINDHVEKFRNPYDADSWFNTTLERLREAEGEASELRTENARLHTLLAKYGHHDHDPPF